MKYSEIQPPSTNQKIKILIAIFGHDLNYQGIPQSNAETVRQLFGKDDFIAAINKHPALLNIKQFYNTFFVFRIDAIDDAV